MTDKELADRIVALGVGKANQIYPDGIGRFYQVDIDADWQTSKNSSKFVRDWRVAGALMEKMDGELLIWRQAYDNDSPVWIVETHLTNADGRDESLPRAIIEACVEALTS